MKIARAQGTAVPSQLDAIADTAGDNGSINVWLWYNCFYVEFTLLAVQGLLSGRKQGRPSSNDRHETLGDEEGNPQKRNYHNNEDLPKAMYVLECLVLRAIGVHNACFV